MGSASHEDLLAFWLSETLVKEVNRHLYCHQLEQPHAKLTWKALRKAKGMYYREQQKPSTPTFCVSFD